MPGIEKQKNKHNYFVYHKAPDGDIKHKKYHLGSFPTYEEAMRVCDIMYMIIGKKCRFKRMDDVPEEDKALAERIRSKYNGPGGLDVSSAAAELSTMNNKRKRPHVEEGIESARETVALICNWSKRMKRAPTEDELNAMVFVLHEQTRHAALKSFNIEMNQQLVSSLTSNGKGGKYIKLHTPDTVTAAAPVSAPQPRASGARIEIDEMAGTWGGPTVASHGGLLEDVAVAREGFASWSARGERPDAREGARQPQAGTNPWDAQFCDLLVDSAHLRSHAIERESAQGAPGFSLHRSIFDD